MFDQAIAPYLHGDWQAFDRIVELAPYQNQLVYSGAEYPGNGQFSKRPNITVVPNLPACGNNFGRLFSLGCTMGHWHKSAGAQRIQEVYEFQSHGLMLLDYEGGQVEMWVCRDGDKVAVPNRCHMTLLNLGDETHPLITLDYCQPKDNAADKTLISSYGPLLLAYYDDDEVVFVVNRTYINNPHHRAGVRLAEIPIQRAGRELRIARRGRQALGEFLHTQLLTQAEVSGQLARLGIRVRAASPEVVLEPRRADERRTYVIRPLVRATQAGRSLQRYFFGSGTELESPETDESIDSDVREPRSNIKLTAHPERLRVLIEGAGDWVTKAYRPLMKSYAGRVHVTYADDTKWSGRRADWADTGLDQWEVYLDKNEPHDFATYRRLKPDVVFVVTPDFTHCDIATGWLGRTDLVLVEKPFATELADVDRLVRQRGIDSRTTVLGIDHYAAYAQPLTELLQHAGVVLGDGARELNFLMTEARPVEAGRDRSLQFGLTLDMVPHLLALLLFFGDLTSVDDVQVLEAGRYAPPAAGEGHGGVALPVAFRRETYSKLRFSLRGNDGARLWCRSLVGKGFAQDVKLLDWVNPKTKAFLRVDFNAKDAKVKFPNNDYPWGHIFFASRQTQVGADRVIEPYSGQPIWVNPTWQRPLARELRYKALLDELLTGGGQAWNSLIPLTDGREMVRLLDVIWRAIDASRSGAWPTSIYGEVDPMA